MVRYYILRWVPLAKAVFAEPRKTPSPSAWKVISRTSYQFPTPSRLASWKADTVARENTTEQTPWTGSNFGEKIWTNNLPIPESTPRRQDCTITPRILSLEYDSTSQLSASRSIGQRAGHAAATLSSAAPPRPRDPCPYSCRMMTQNARGLKRPHKLESVIDLMCEKNIQVCCMQETWLIGDWQKMINGYMVFHHGLDNQTCNRGSCGVLIILSPLLIKAWEREGSLPPLTGGADPNVIGRIIGVTVSFPRFDLKCRKISGKINFLITSVYHPVELEDQILFNDSLSAYFSNAPRKSEIITGSDINANVGIRTTRYAKEIGPFGLNNRNAKGIKLNNLLKFHNFKILLSFFAHRNYVTWKSFGTSASPHMLDNWICCNAFQKRVSDCRVISYGVESDHSAVLVQFRVRAIKFVRTNKVKKSINWRKLATDEVVKRRFNDKLRSLINLQTNQLMPDERVNKAHTELSYQDFMENIVHAAKQTSTTEKHQNKGWYEHSSNILTPIIGEKTRILNIIRNSAGFSNATIDFLKRMLKKTQQKVKDAIAIAMSRWSSVQADKIHNMNKNPKDAWAAIKILKKGLTGHHVHSTIMHMKLPSGALASTDEENASIFGPHLEKVYNAKRPVDWDYVKK